MFVCISNAAAAKEATDAERQDEADAEADAELAALVLVTDVAAASLISCESFGELLGILRSAASTRSRHREALPLLLRRLLLASRTHHTIPRHVTLQHVTIILSVSISHHIHRSCRIATCCAMFITCGSVGSSV